MTYPIVNGTATLDSHPQFHNAYVDVKAHYGAVGDGLTDDSTAIQAAVTAAGSTGTVFFPPATYNLATTTVTFTCHVRGTGAELIYSGTDAAVQLGNGTALTNRKLMFLPDIRFTGTDAGTAWSVSGVTGVRVKGLASSKVFVERIAYFDRGLYLTSSTNGVAFTAYDDFHIGHLDTNKKNCYIDEGGVGSGFANECNFFGGRYSQDSNYGTNVTGARHIFVDFSGTNRPNNHRWWGASLEGNTFENGKQVETEGSNCLWFWCRWESSNPGVVFNTGSIDNMVFMGHSAQSLVITDSGSNNRVVTRNYDAWEAGTADGVLRLSNSQSSNSPTIAILPAGGDVFGSTGSTYTVGLAANTSSFKATADSVARLAIANTTGTMSWSDGSGAADATLSRSAANVLSTGSDDALRTGRSIHGSLPAATGYAAGSMYYCTTDKQPLWSDGTNWIEADGSTH